MDNQQDIVPDPQSTPPAPRKPPQPIASEHKTPTPGQGGRPKGSPSKPRTPPS